MFLLWVEAAAATSAGLIMFVIMLSEIVLLAFLHQQPGRSSSRSLHIFRDVHSHSDADWGSWRESESEAFSITVQVYNGILAAQSGVTPN